jgi:putative ABC transport system permease protein
MPPDQKQVPMTFVINRGEVYIGYDLAHARGIEQGDHITLFGKTMTVARCLLPTGSVDDIRIHGHLHDIQEMLQLEGRINEIRALECLCLFESGKTGLDPLALAQAQLAEILPEAKVILLKGIADVRQQQRAAMEGYLALILPIVLIACGIWIGILAMINVRDRQQEIGIMQALGHRPEKIAALFLGKSIIIGVVGALLGFAAGTLSAYYFGAGIFKITANNINPIYDLLLWTVVGAPVFAAISSFIPAMSAMSQDPAMTLRPR